MNDRAQTTPTFADGAGAHHTGFPTAERTGAECSARVMCSPPATRYRRPGGTPEANRHRVDRRLGWRCVWLRKSSLCVAQDIPAPRRTRLRHGCRLHTETEPTRPTMSCVLPSSIDFATALPRLCDSSGSLAPWSASQPPLEPAAVWSRISAPSLQRLGVLLAPLPKPGRAVIWALVPSLFGEPPDLPVLAVASSPWTATDL